MAVVWMLVRAGRTGKRSNRVGAVCLPALTQFAYLGSRVPPLLLLLVLQLKLPPRWWKIKALPAGAGAFLPVALALLIPQIAWNARYPATFLSRTSQTVIIQNPLCTELGLAGTLVETSRDFSWPTALTVGCDASSQDQLR